MDSLSPTPHTEIKNDYPYKINQHTNTKKLLILYLYLIKYKYSCSTSNNTQQLNKQHTQKYILTQPNQILHTY
jgi:hypothetical protein